MKQHIHVSSKSYRLPHAPSYVVLVMPEGAERGEYYRVGAYALNRLEEGDTPDDLGLEPINAEDE